MKTVSIQNLKDNLSAVIEQAEAGETVIVTRHKRPVAQILPAHPQHVRRGRDFGRGKIPPAAKQATKGRYLRVLLDDRGDR